MKVNIVFLFWSFIINSLIAQVDFRLSLGIDFFSSPSMTDYINQSNFTEESELSTFSSAINFSGESGLMISDFIQVTGDLAYQLYSYNSMLIQGRYEIVFNNLMPSILAYYVFEGIGYNFKFGGGAGIRIVNVKENLPASVKSSEYFSTGVGFLVRTQGNTLISDNIFANICIDLRYDVNGTPENNGIKLYNYVLKENVNFNQIAFGIKLGLYYKF